MGSGAKLEVEEITEKDDLRRGETQSRVCSLLDCKGDALLYSAPCTGGSGWQKINWTLGDGTRIKIARHWKLFRELWSALVIIAESLIPKGVIILIEWPRGCAYWHDKAVQKFLVKWGFRFAEFDGCMYGLKSGEPKTYGDPIKKPWRIAFVNCNLDEHNSQKM